MQFKSCALLFMVVFATGCGFPKVDFSYQGNGDEGILEFMRGNYMSSEAIVAKEHFSGLPKANAERTRRVTAIEARVVLASPIRIEVVKELSHPDLGKLE
jgi:hypothetical protein